MMILASGSPRRKELLKKVRKDFTIVVPSINEDSLHFLPAKDLPLEESRLKAYSLANRYPDDEILACDTVVVLGSEILGKPKNKEDAKAMLRMLSNKRHTVLSGYTYLSKGKEITRTVSTHVYFNELSEEQIDDYLERFHPFDKAGSYGIQDDFPLVHHIEGSFDNVMGLPTEDLLLHLPH